MEIRNVYGHVEVYTREENSCSPPTPSGRPGKSCGRWGRP